MSNIEIEKQMDVLHLTAKLKRIQELKELELDQQKALSEYINQHLSGDYEAGQKVLQIRAFYSEKKSILDKYWALEDYEIEKFRKEKERERWSSKRR
jgi:hypothetical protein